MCRTYHISPCMSCYYWKKIMYLCNNVNLWFTYCQSCSCRNWWEIKIENTVCCSTWANSSEYKITLSMWLQMANEKSSINESHFHPYIIILAVVCIRLIIFLIFSDNCQRRMLTCRSMWRRKVMRKSDWVAQTRSCSGVCKRANWVHACHPTSHHSINLLQAKAHHPISLPFLDEPHHLSFTFFLSVFSSISFQMYPLIRRKCKQTFKVLSVVI